MFATGETVGLVEWIIDDTCLVSFNVLKNFYIPNFICKICILSPFRIVCKIYFIRGTSTLHCMFFMNCFSKYLITKKPQTSKYEMDYTKWDFTAVVKFSVYTARSTFKILLLEVQVWYTNFTISKFDIKITSHWKKCEFSIWPRTL